MPFPLFFYVIVYTFSGIFHTALYFGLLVFPISLEVTWCQSLQGALTVFAMWLAQSKARIDHFWMNESLP